MADSLIGYSFEGSNGLIYTVVDKSKFSDAYMDVEVTDAAGKYKDKTVRPRAHLLQHRAMLQDHPRLFEEDALDSDYDTD